MRQTSTWGRRRAGQYDLAAGIETFGRRLNVHREAGRSHAFR